MNDKRTLHSPKYPLADGSPGEGESSILDKLQEPMEAIALGAESNKGRFCGGCYAKLGEPLRRNPSHLPANYCETCSISSNTVAPVEQVPDEVLRIYLAKRRREGLIVNLFAFLGIFLSLLISAALWFLLPDNWWRVTPFAVLAFGSYYLAQVIGYNVGVPVGSRSGRRIRDRLWQEYLARGRAIAETPCGPSTAD